MQDQTLLKPLTDEEHLAKRNKQVAFLQAIHEFVENDEISAIFEKRSDQGVAALMKALSTLEPHIYMGVTSYILGKTDRIALQKYLRPDEQIDNFFQKIGDDNKHTPVIDWDRTAIEKKANERMGRNVFHIHDFFEQIATRAGINAELKKHISTTLLDIAWRDPHEVPVTIENVANMLRKADIPMHLSQDRYWVDLKCELQDIQTEDKELKALVDTITTVATESGLFTAVQNLLGESDKT